MAEISVNPSWRLQSDPHTWIVQRLKYVNADDHPKEPGKENWESVAFHQTLEGAIQACISRQVRCSDARGWDGVMAEYRRAAREVADAVDVARRQREAAAWRTADVPR